MSFLLEVLIYFGIELFALIASGIPRRGESRADRAQRLALDKQHRWLRRWAKGEPPRDAIPDRGFCCEYCGFALVGLTKPLCPECGRRVVA